MSERLDVDVVVVGSGFGGSVAALRLAEKDYDVTVFEAGREFADDDFANTSWDVRRYLWAPLLGCFGVQRVHLLPDVLILAGAGVGGGSLNYANTLYVPGETFYRDPQWADLADWAGELAPHYATAQRMLGVVENTCDGPVEQIMADAAARVGRPETYRHTPVGVFLGTPGVRVPDPYFDGAGPERTGCTLCGNCMVGCRVGAKNTLVKNYLHLARSLGARVESRRTVVEVRPLDGGCGATGFAVTTQATGRWWARDRRTITAHQVVLAAGTWGTQSLLHRLRASTLPALSPALGRHTRTNSEALGGVEYAEVPPGVDLTRGLAITTSFYVDEVTHVENCRYGAGSNLLGLLGTPLPSAGHGLRDLARDVWREPRGVLRRFGNRRFSERVIIALVMQALDNAIDVTARPGLLGRVLPGLTSRQATGTPNPVWPAQATRGVRAMQAAARQRLGGEPGAASNVGALLGMPLTAHFIGGATMGADRTRGVIDKHHRVWGYPGLHIVDGSAISANLGVNPALTITALAERAFAAWPRRGEPDRRPEQRRDGSGLAAREPEGAAG